nr:hypothetical protein [Anaeromusa acidaminophila]
MVEHAMKRKFLEAGIVVMVRLASWKTQGVAALQLILRVVYVYV